MIGSVYLLPLVRKHEIRDLIYKFDCEFPNSVVDRSDFNKVIDNIENRAFVITANVENKIVGFCAFYINDFEKNIAYITLIAVDSKYRGKHIGKELLDYVKRTAKLNKFSIIRLEVENDNGKAIEFYKRNGFEEESSASDSSKYMFYEIQY